MQGAAQRSPVHETRITEEFSKINRCLVFRAQCSCGWHGATWPTAAGADISAGFHQRWEEQKVVQS